MGHVIFKEGSLLGGILLIAGSCIGAGMLALPVITGIAGFSPSVVMFLLAWLFMTGTGLLLLEANLATCRNAKTSGLIDPSRPHISASAGIDQSPEFSHQPKSNSSAGLSISLISIAERTLGKTGKILCWLLFLFLFYSLSIAYIAASGSILQSITADLFGLPFPAWGGSLLFTAVFAVVIYIGTRHVDYVNRILMGGLIISYCILVMLGSLHINPAYLAVRNWKYSFAALPVLIISFGFHNMIPSLAMYMRGDARRLRLTILVGSAIPLIIYLLWEAVMLGIIPVEGREGLLNALDQGEAATQALRAIVGKSWINTLAQAFALFAIVTSFLAQSLSLVDFLADGLKIAKVGVARVALVLMTLLPPFAFAFVYPGIFLKALNLAGGFAAVILFGVMPVLMVWKLRYVRKEETTHMVPCGRLLLSCILFVALAIFLLETAHELGFSLLPNEANA